MVDDSLSFWTDIKRYEDELNADPSSMCFIRLAELYRRLGLLDDAVSVARKGAALHPQSVDALLVLGETCHDRGIPDEARTALEMVLAIDPDNVPALKVLGRIFAADAEFEKAQQLLEHALRQAPDDPEIAFLLSSLDAAPPNKPVMVEEPVEDVEPVGAFDDLDAVEELIELEDIEAVEELEEMEELEGLLDLDQLEDKGAPLQSVGRQPSLVEKPVPPVAPAGPGEVAAAEPASPAPAKNPLSTVTMAELYVSQGFLDKALEVYGDLLAADPGNSKYISRSAELIELRAREAAVAGSAQAAAPEPETPEMAATPEPEAPGDETAAKGGATSAEMINRLSQWLENIRSRRHGI